MNKILNIYNGTTGNFITSYDYEDIVNDNDYDVLVPLKDEQYMLFKSILISMDKGYDLSFKQGYKSSTY